MEKKISNDDDDYFLRPNNARELILPDHLEPFIMQYIKDMKNEGIEIMISPACLKFLTDLDCPLEDLSQLTDDEVMKFKEMFQANRISKSHKGLTKTMDTLFDYMIDILSKRVPIENVSVKVEQIIGKIRLVEVPDHLVLQDCTETVTVEKDGVKVEEKVEKKRNTNERALLLVKVPQFEDEEEVKVDGEDGPKVEIVKKMVDEDQKEKALSVIVRDVTGIKGDNKQFFNINCYAGEAYRQEFIDYINKSFPEFFDDNDDMDQIMKAANE